MRVAARLQQWLLGRRPSARLPVSAATVDLDDPAVALDPFPTYELLREAGPVQYLARHGAWIVLGYEQVQSLFARPDAFSNQPYDDVDAVLLGADPPEHTAIRRTVSRYFSRDVVESLGSFTAGRARSLLEPQFDAVQEFGEPLSESVAARLLGFDDAAIEQIRGAYSRSTDFGAFLSALDAVAERAQMYADLRRDGLEEHQARSLVRLFWVASTKTTERVIAQCVLALLRHDDVRATVSGDEETIGPFVDEVMRLHPPEPILRRITTQPVELGGAQLPAGAHLMLCLTAANRDPARYEAPAELRIDRPRMQHLTFGYGIHRCIGAMLGRAVVVEAVRALLRHAPRLQAVHSLEDVRHCGTMTAHYVESLVIRIDESGRGSTGGHDESAPNA